MQQTWTHSHTASALFLLAAVFVTLGCAPGDFGDDGAADLTLTAGEDTPLQIIHAPGESQVRLTPPVDGEVELSFTYNDPLVDVSLRTNANDVAEGDLVALPSTVLALSVLLDDIEYTAGEGSSGNVELQVLAIDDESGAADVSAVIDALLISAEGEELVVDGFIEGSVAGDAS